MYTDRNFPTKKALKEAVAAAVAGTGRPVTYCQPGPFGDTTVRDGLVTIEGPHYPEPHSWYARCAVVNGEIRAVK